MKALINIVITTLVMVVSVGFFYILGCETAKSCGYDEIETPVIMCSGCK